MARKSLSMSHRMTSPYPQEAIDSPEHLAEKLTIALNNLKTTIQENWREYVRRAENSISMIMQGLDRPPGRQDRNAQPSNQRYNRENPHSKGEAKTIMWCARLSP